LFVQKIPFDLEHFCKLERAMKRERERVQPRTTLPAAFPEKDSKKHRGPEFRVKTLEQKHVQADSMSSSSLTSSQTRRVDNSSKRNHSQGHKDDETQDHAAGSESQGLVQSASHKKRKPIALTSSTLSNLSAKKAKSVSAVDPPQDARKSEKQSKRRREEEVDNEGAQPTVFNTSASSSATVFNFERMESDAETADNLLFKAKRRKGVEGYSA